MAYVGGLRVNRSDMASRFMVGLIELPITNNCTVANASFKVLNYNTTTCKFIADGVSMSVNPYPTAFPYGNGMVLHFYQQQESSTTKTVHKVINKGLKAYV